MANILQELGVPFFLICGTALGFHREGRFIPHDPDIDLGIFHSDFQALDNSQNPHLLVEIQEAAKSRFRLVASWGKISDGLEMKFKHHDTKVDVDLMLLYRDQDQYWLASYVIKKRKSKKGNKKGRIVGIDTYQYKWLRGYVQDSLELTSIQGKTFQIIPKKWLNLNYGPDWSTPQVFSYWQGVKKNFYRNRLQKALIETKNSKP